MLFYLVLKSLNHLVQYSKENQRKILFSRLVLHKEKYNRKVLLTEFRLNDTHTILYRKQTQKYGKCLLPLKMAKKVTGRV